MKERQEKHGPDAYEDQHPCHYERNPKEHSLEAVKLLTSYGHGDTFSSNLRIENNGPQCRDSNHRLL